MHSAAYTDSESPRRTLDRRIIPVPVRARVRISPRALCASGRDCVRALRARAVQLLELGFESLPVSADTGIAETAVWQASSVISSA
jgi:hypothetical protein